MTETTSYEDLLAPTSLIDQGVIPSFLLTFRDPLEQTMQAVRDGYVSVAEGKTRARDFSTDVQERVWRQVRPDWTSDLTTTRDIGLGVRANMGRTKLTALNAFYNFVPCKLLILFIKPRHHNPRVGSSSLSSATKLPHHPRESRHARRAPQTGMEYRQLFRSPCASV